MNQMKYFIISAIVFLFLQGCTEKYPNHAEGGGPVVTGSNCEVCHLDKDLLKEIAEPLPPTNGESGEG